MKGSKHSFDIRVEVDNKTGAVMAVYFSFRKGKSAQVKEFCDGAAIADYNRNGHLLGVELLAPCEFSVLRKIKGVEPETRQFLRNAAPREMVLA